MKYNHKTKLSPKYLRNSKLITFTSSVNTPKLDKNQISKNDFIFNEFTNINCKKSSSEISSPRYDHLTYPLLYSLQLTTESENFLNTNP